MLQMNALRLARRSCTVAAYAFVLSMTLAMLPAVSFGQRDSPESESVNAESTASLAAGHSNHGEAFNEGPRQQARLIGGTGPIQFEVSSQVSRVGDFIRQGIGQLHGFWYFEAERSFRQAVMLDPDYPLGYWGMAMANQNNDERAKEFIDRAMARIENGSPREQRYIEALHAFLTKEPEQPETSASDSAPSDSSSDSSSDASSDDGKGKEPSKKSKEKDRQKAREAKLIAEFESIAKEFPDDIEAKAFLGYFLYRYRDSAGRSHSEVDVVLDQVLAKEKSHPAHHYRIHLWDHESPQRALDSAARCGPSAPSIAHMWHMCGHIFSRLKRYDDAAWFQEASARVDHRHMMHDLVLPDQIHNFAHNNEWLIRNLMHVGRVDDALALAKNMIELPRHPKYNMLDERHSASYGRERLIDVLERFELWPQVIELSQGPYLEPTDVDKQKLKRWRLLGKAHAALAQQSEAEAVVSDIERQRAEWQQRRTELDGDTDNQSDDETAEPDKTSATDDDAEEDDAEQCDSEKERKKELKEIKDLIKRADRAVALIRGHLAWQAGDLEKAAELLDAGKEDDLTVARLEMQMEKSESALKKARKYIKDRPAQVQPLCGLIELLHQANELQAARTEFQRLRAGSRAIQFSSPVFSRVGAAAADLGFPEDWRVAVPDPDDLGERPDVRNLGPFRWQPVPAPNWVLPDSSGRLIDLHDYRGKPVLVVFYLGYGCLHCAEQIQAIAPRTEEFAEAGISIVAISSDNIDGLERSQENYSGERIPFPLVSDASNEVFRAYRAYDDFEDLPLHGTYLIDADGRVRWQDISYEPFMDVDFLLDESRRLLAQPTNRVALPQLAGSR